MPGTSAIALTQWLTGLSLEKGKNLYQHGHRPLLSLHPCQRRLRLGQPEGHVHGAIKRDGGRQVSAGRACSRWPLLTYSVPRPW